MYAIIKSIVLPNSICRLPVDTTMAMYTCNVITVTTINDPTTSKIQNTDLLFFMLINVNYSYDDWPPQYEWLTHNLSESMYKIDFHFTKPCCINAIVWFVSWSICSWPISTKQVLHYKSMLKNTYLLKILWWIFSFD